MIGKIVNVRRASPIPLLAVTGAYKDLYLEVAEYLGAQDGFGSQTGRSQPLTPILDAFERLVHSERASRPSA